MNCFHFHDFEIHSRCKPPSIISKLVPQKKTKTKQTLLLHFFLKLSLHSSVLKAVHYARRFVNHSLFSELSVKNKGINTKTPSLRLNPILHTISKKFSSKSR